MPRVSSGDLGHLRNGPDAWKGTRHFRTRRCHDGRIGDDAKFYHQYHPDFAVDSNTTMFADGLSMSPFMEAMCRHGHKELVERMKRVGQFRERVRSNGVDIDRMLRNFRTRNWKQYDKDVVKLGGSLAGADGLESVRLHRLRDLLSGVLEPIFGSATHTRRVLEMHQLLESLASASSTDFNAMLRNAIAAGQLALVHQDLLDVLARFLRLSEELRSVLPEWNPDQPDLPIPDSIVVAVP